ncbi:uncharacterized protein LOC129900220 [Solanum dulcamara]|uniref:uncharacterized protein LOC129900220 n=1 Tax=Solanum dulcamara TaxID=45834 RepID=UPI002486167D|nr:uncharacterized protein LOC129900220 [Solanum dulcamara]
MEAWNCLRDIFHDNKHSRAVTLEYDFIYVNITDFSNVSTYCQHLKSLADQLKNIGSLVANDRLVLPLISRFTEPYQGVATLISQRDLLPQFYQARSMLTLEKAGRAKKMSQSSSAALVARSSEGSPHILDNFSYNRNSNSWKKNHNRSNNGENIATIIVVVEAAKELPSAAVIQVVVVSWEAATTAVLGSCQRGKILCPILHGLARSSGCG